MQPKEIKKEKIDPEFGDTGVGLNGLNGLQNENKNDSSVKTDHMQPNQLNDANSEDGSVAGKRVLMDPQSEQIESTLTDIGELIVDPDVLFALQNLKALGKSLRDNETELQKTQHSKFGRNLFEDFHTDIGQAATNILNPIGGRGSAAIKQESQASKEFNIPPQTGRVFSGMKRLTPDAFAGISSTKKRKSGTPSRVSVGGSPGSGSATNAEIIQVQSESKGKLAVGMQMFITKKKMMTGNHMTIFDAVKKKGHDVIDFPEGPQSFYRIMTHYAASLNFVPEDIRHKHLQQDLFTFVMKNVDYTKVKIVIMYYVNTYGINC